MVKKNSNGGGALPPAELLAATTAGIPPEAVVAVNLLDAVPDSDPPDAAAAEPPPPSPRDTVTAIHVKRPHIVDPEDEGPGETPTPTAEEALDEDEREFRRLRCDLPGVRGAAAQGIVSISVSKKPKDNEFFRTHPTFRPSAMLVHTEVGMERQFFAVTPEMEVPLFNIGIKCRKHTLYLTILADGATAVIPILQGTDNEYIRTKEIGLLDGAKRWVRLFTDEANNRYQVFPAPDGRFDDPTWLPMTDAKIFRLCFRDKGRLVDSTEHELYKKWSAARAS